MQTIVADTPGACEASDDNPVLGIVRQLREPGVLEAKVREAWSQAGGAPPLRSVAVLDTYCMPSSHARILAKAVLASERKPGREVTQYLYLQVYASRARALRRFATASAAKPLRCLGPAVSYLEPCNTVVWALPNGPRLKKVRACFKRKSFTKFIAELGLSRGSENVRLRKPQLLRYVPRRRALFLYAPRDRDAGRFYIKFYRRGEDVIGAGNLTALNNASLDFRVPRLVAHSARKRAVVMDEVPGGQLTALLSDPRPEIFEAVGRAIAQLHTSDVVPTHDWTPELETSALRKAVADLVKAQPEMAVRLGGLLDRIDQERRHLSFDERRPIHGNLFADQILIDGKEVGIVDWDDLPLGDPLFDVGRLIAHLIFVSRQRGLDRTQLGDCVQHMLETYAQESGAPVATDRLSWHVVVALLLRAKISALRALSPSWKEDVAATAEEAASLLDSRGIWVPA